MLATSIPGKDEFSTEGSAHNIMKCGDLIIVVCENLVRASDRQYKVCQWPRLSLMLRARA
jgi:hypothetical protein